MLFCLVWGGGVPIQSWWWGVPHSVLAGGIPHPGLVGPWGIPATIRTWDGVPPRPDLGWGTPPPGRGVGLTHKVKILPSPILRMRVVKIWTSPLFHERDFRNRPESLNVEQDDDEVLFGHQKNWRSVGSLNARRSERLINKYICVMLTVSQFTPTSRIPFIQTIVMII